MSTASFDVGKLDPREPGLSLRRAWNIFVHQLTAQVLMVLLAAIVALRLQLGNFGWGDLGVIALLLAVHPFGEWAIHVFGLHFRPRTILGVKLDLHMARLHRAHHEAPHDPNFWFIPKRSGAMGLVVIALLSWLLLPTIGLAVTSVAVNVAVSLTYEWVHYLCHSSYRPRSAFYRRIWRHHRLHHFKNEHYWMGVTRHFGDKVLGTDKDVRDVETSPTCRKLFGQDEE